MAFVSFMNSQTGRWLRGIVGAILVLLALFVVEGVGGWILLILGALLLVLALFNICLLGLLFKGK